MESSNLPKRKSNRRSRSNGPRARCIKKQVISSVNQLEQGEEKILNATDETMFLNTAEVFADMLNLIEINEDIYESLLNLHSIIKKKLATFEYTNEGNADGTSSLKSLQSTSLASSMQSLCSVSSLSVKYFDEDNPEFKKFLVTVNCPFCYKPQTDKMHLIKHLDETCQPLINDTFEERNCIPFSAFQILPNNTIKCNICQNSVQKSLKAYFVHKQSPKHASQYDKATKFKNYTEFLFCSSCKVLVPNNYTQVDFHIKHETHKSRSILAPTTDMHKKGITCVYIRSKKFRCLVCPSKPTFQNPKEVLSHFEQTHRKHGKKEAFPRVFCDFCRNEVHILELIHHFASAVHADNEKAESIEQWFELCYFCDFVCANLKELSLHMKKQCKEIMNIKGKNIESGKLSQKNPVNETSKELRNLQVPLTQNKALVERVTVIQGNVGAKEGLHIIVKDSTDVPEIYKYFQKFGEITGVDIYEEKNVLVHFRQKSTVDDILFLRDVIKINGVRMKVTTIEELIRPMDATKKSQKEIGPKKTSQGLATKQIDVKIPDKTDSDSPSDDDTEAPLMKIEMLFQNVSHHLSSTAKIFDCGLHDQILGDCSKIFGQEKCSIVGFAGCNLSFPVESIKIYCDVGGPHTTEHSLDSQKSLIASFYNKLRIEGTSEWERVVCQFDENFPQIECKHKATQKMCAFTFMPSAKIITNILRDCIKEERLTEKFILIVRFWFSVRELKRPASEFAIISLLIFFIMNKKVVRNFFNLDAHHIPYSAFFHALSVKFERTAYSCSPLRSNGVARTFHLFLKFLINFDFDNTFICLPVEYPVPKSFVHTSPYSHYFSSLKSDKLQSVPMWIIDPLLCVNLTSDVSKTDLISILEAARTTLKSRN